MNSLDLYWSGVLSIRMILFHTKGAYRMDWNLKITDMAGATPEHSSVIVNFVAAVRYQLKNSTCYVYSDNVQYRFKDADGNNKIVISDASINCRTKSRRGNTFTDDPRFVMEVRLVHFPNIKITFEDLFDEIDY